MIRRPTFLIFVLTLGLFQGLAAQSQTLDELLKGLREDQSADGEEIPAPPETGVKPDFLENREAVETPPAPPATPERAPAASRAPVTPPEPAPAPQTTPAPRTTPATEPAAPGPSPRIPVVEEGEYNPFLMANLDKLLQSDPGESIHLHLTFPGSDLLTQEQVTQGAAIVQGIGLRTDLKPLQITYGPQLAPGRFNVLIGTISQIGSVLGRELIEEIGNSGLCLIPMPGQEDQPVLVITGTSQKGINEAVLALGFVNMNFPAAQFVSIRRILFPETPPYFGQPPVNPGTTYTFKQLQEVGAPIRPVQTGGIGIQIYFPADIFRNPTPRVNFAIHFSAGQNALRSNALVVRLNGTEVSRTPWDQTTASEFGGRYLNFSLPLGRFLSGRNLLEITTDSFSSGSQFTIGPRALPANDLRIFTNSTIEIPNVTRAAPLPDLRTTSRTLYPFVGRPDGSEISFLLTDNREETVCAAWMLIAKFSQMSNTFLYGAEVSFTIANPDRHMIVIGSQSRIPPTLRDRIPEASFSELGSSREIDDYLVEDERQPTAIERFFQSVKDEFVKIEIRKPAEEEATAGSQTRENVSAPIGPRAVMTSFPSPAAQNRWVLVVTARNDALLLERVRQLVRLPYWSQISGYLFSWNNTPSSVRDFQPEQTFREVSLRDIIEVPFGYGVSLRIWYIFAAVVFLIFIFMTLLVLKHMDHTIAQRRKE